MGLHKSPSFVSPGLGWWWLRSPNNNNSNNARNINNDGSVDNNNNVNNTNNGVVPDLFLTERETAGDLRQVP